MAPYYCLLRIFAGTELHRWVANPNRLCTYTGSSLPLFNEAIEPGPKLSGPGKPNTAPGWKPNQKPGRANRFNMAFAAPSDGQCGFLG